MGAAHRYLAVGRLLGILVHGEGEVAAGSQKHQFPIPLGSRCGHSYVSVHDMKQEYV